MTRQARSSNVRRRLAQVLGFSVGAWLAGLAGSAPALAFETELLQNSGPGANRVNIFILGDGYRVEDQTLLRNRAIALANDFWVHAPFAAFRPFFNVKLIKTISADDGAVNGNNPPSQPTIFQSFFNCGGIDRLLCIGDTARLDQVLQADAPEYNPAFDIVLVTVNDLKYGGAGSAQYATTSAEPDAPSIAVHEIGHSFADLADEYEDVQSAIDDRVHLAQRHHLLPALAGEVERLDRRQHARPDAGAFGLRQHRGRVRGGGVLVRGALPALGELLDARAGRDVLPGVQRGAGVERLRQDRSHRGARPRGGVADAGAGGVADVLVHRAEAGAEHAERHLAP